jgi:hypothetical protein
MALVGSKNIVTQKNLRWWNLKILIIENPLSHQKKNSIRQ